MAYNPWYTDTYEPILDIADWGNFTEDVPKKMVAIFSWMPQTIMSIKHSGNQFKYQLYDMKSLIDALEKNKKKFDSLKDLSLLDVELAAYKQKISDIHSALYPIMGSVATSKYLHFSAPFFFPMWDRRIRLKGGFGDDSNGYFAYMLQFKADLMIKENFNKAKQKYPGNPIRGWDIISMEER